MRAGEMEEAAVDIAEGLWPVTGERMASEPFASGEVSAVWHEAEGRLYVVQEFEGYKVLGYQSNVGLSDWAERWVLISVLDASLAQFIANTLSVYDVLQWASYWIRDRTIDGEALQAWHLFGQENLLDQGKVLTALLTNYCSTITGEYWEGLASSDGMWPVLGTPVSTRPFHQMRLIERIARPGQEDLFLSDVDGVNVLCCRAALGDEQGMERWVFVEVLGDTVAATKAGRAGIRETLDNSDVWVMDRTYSACVRAWRLPGLRDLPEDACPFTVRPARAVAPSSNEFSGSTGWHEFAALSEPQATDIDVLLPVNPEAAAPGGPLELNRGEFFPQTESPPPRVRQPIAALAGNTSRRWLRVSAFVLLLAAEIRL